MSERPVPRRESPWGVSDGYHREPKAHRCNDRAEDVIYCENPFSGSGFGLKNYRLESISRGRLLKNLTRRLLTKFDWKASRQQVSYLITM
ncbi:hypothetical protein OROGR_015249 [Orobanche gracilis]